ncbi:5'-nucleotidase C-terminal domain-containing protein [Bengtsoniella intestinalis]|uniref:5'-nucleotidase C-terminal domain-containing protein n=1 Tax=Bengtsoniella intestinalis TaxID=3073143 RepID=UPI00391FB36C
MKKRLCVLFLVLGLMSNWAYATDVEQTTLSPTEMLTETLPETYGDDTIFIVHTNDTHCGIDYGFGFAGVASYYETLGGMYDNVALVDAGDAIQGAAVGLVTKGEALTSLMIETGYEVFTLGNHEFDYGMEVLTERMDELLDKGISVLSGNFSNIQGDEPVYPYEAYTIETYGDVSVAYVGITTPLTLTSADPTTFKDEQGNLIYSFGNDDGEAAFYALVQSLVDEANAQADYVVLLAHLGVDDSPYRSIDIVAATEGIDVVIDGHSHTVMEGDSYPNKNGEEVLITQAGTQFQCLGVVTIDPSTDTIGSFLVMPEAYTYKNDVVLSMVAEINAELEAELGTVVGHSDYDLIVAHPDTDTRLVRSVETNMGDFVSDAFRTVFDTDIAFAHGGGLRSGISAGDITKGDIMDVRPFGNQIVAVYATGQQILDALELGAMVAPQQENGAFLQVSGLTYVIDSSFTSTVEVDPVTGDFIQVTGEYRVGHVYVDDEPLDLTKTYTLAADAFLLCAGGNGFTMFLDCQRTDMDPIVDTQVLETYLVDYLDGEVSEEYSALYGQDRITDVHVEFGYTEESDADVAEVEESLVETPVENTVETYTVVAGDTLWKIATMYLGDGSKYDLIYQMNTDILTDPNCIYVGQVLKIAGI